MGLTNLLILEVAGLLVLQVGYYVKVFFYHFYIFFLNLNISDSSSMQYNKVEKP